MTHDQQTTKSAPLLRILVLNGPNLGHLGERRPDIYGSKGMEALPALLRHFMGAAADEIDLCFFQANSEGALIDRLEQARSDGVHGVVFNAGAYSHTSLALADCIEWIGLPVVEVHISNVFARAEAIRHHSYLAAHVLGCICGFGIAGYAMAVQALYARLRVSFID